MPSWVFRSNKHQSVGLRPSHRGPNGSADPPVVTSPDLVRVSGMMYLTAGRTLPLVPYPVVFVHFIIGKVEWRPREQPPTTAEVGNRSHTTWGERQSRVTLRDVKDVGVAAPTMSPFVERWSLCENRMDCGTGW